MTLHITEDLSSHTTTHHRGPVCNASHHRVSIWRCPHHAQSIQSYLPSQRFHRAIPSITQVPSGNASHHTGNIETYLPSHRFHLVMPCITEVVSGLTFHHRGSFCNASHHKVYIWRCLTSGMIHPALLPSQRFHSALLSFTEVPSALTLHHSSSFQP